MSDIKLYKTLAGQELVARVVEQGIGWVILEQVLAIQVKPTGPDTYQLGFVPFSPSDPDGKWKFKESLLLGEHAEGCPEAVRKAYIQQTSSIEIVSNLNGL